MSEAYKCDRCGEFRPGSPDGTVELKRKHGSFLWSDSVRQLCAQCTSEVRASIVGVHPQPEPEIVSSPAVAKQKAC